jgi:hypothetical protein
MRELPGLGVFFRHILEGKLLGLEKRSSVERGVIESSRATPRARDT